MTKMTKTLGSRVDVLSITPTVLGFMPENSVVFLGIGRAPTARVDLGEPHELADAVAAAAAHWRERGALVVVYSDDAQAADAVLDSLHSILPGVPVHDAFRVAEGRIYDAHNPVGTPYVAPVDLDLGEVVFSRQQLVDAAAQIQSPAEADRLAREAYDAGKGAAAWCYLDRARDLDGDSAERADLDYRLRNAIRPTP